MIIALAGHVDHGKTTLVQLLTGKNTDSLAEEQRRGLTIDLGFAYLEHRGRRLGFVDVPGHHRFIHNMVAGIAAQQCALLVIAADDGPMPQSREHLQILQLLGVRQGIIALTKCDRADTARRDAARTEIARLVAGTFLESAPILETAATGPGIDALREALLRLPAVPAPAFRGNFRMPLDRVFRLRGAGLVVTGTVHSGRIAVDQPVSLFPGGGSARVREIRVQDRPATYASAGDRTAINLASLDGAAPERGHWLGTVPDPGHRQLVLDATLLDDFPRPVRHWTPVHVYHATTHTTAHLALLEGSRALPGERLRLELVCDRPLLAKYGDALLIRDQGLDATLGGGTLIDNQDSSGRRRSTTRLRRLDALADPDPARALAALLDQGPVDVAGLQRLRDLPDTGFASLQHAGPATLHDGQLIRDDLWHDWRESLRQECDRRHSENPALQGLRQNDFRSPVPEPFRGELLRELVADGTLRQRAGHYQPGEHRAALTMTEDHLLQRLTPLLDRPQPPSLGDIGRQLRMPPAELQAGVRALASKGQVILVNDRRAYLPAQLLPLAELALRLADAGPFDARTFRDATAIGRNVAIELLEFFDARGFTHRSGDLRSVTGSIALLQPTRPA